MQEHATEEKAFPAYKRIGLPLGLGLGAYLFLMPCPQGMTPEGQKVAAMAALMAIWWITECVPIAATALVPLILLPLAGVLSMKSVSVCYGDANILLFAGGFFIASAMQRWQLHKRMALLIVHALGGAPRRMVLGFMIATAFLSMWISNTATCMMMLPIGLSVAGQLELEQTGRSANNFSIALMLGIAYGASIGGIGTLIGTPPNIVLAAQMRNLFPDAPEIGFFQWMLVGVPLVLVFLPITWLLLTRVIYPLPKTGAGGGADLVRKELKALGPMSRGEWLVLIVFTATALAWIFRRDLELGAFTMPGWARLFPQPKYIHDGTVAIFFAVLLFALPVDYKKGVFVLDWPAAKEIPWGILLLFGGGLAIALGFKDTGLIGWVGERLAVLSGFSPLFVILVTALLMTFLTEITSNTATTTIMLPILAATASQVLNVNPLLLMIPATISASCAFMLPVATPPNAIVFGSGKLTVLDMARSGFVLNLLGVLLVTLLTYWLVVPLFEISFNALPVWAQ
jgi:solute carrier family 13 (sodium-dependent dicarboxylate transporter), member 2/3/5